MLSQPTGNNWSIENHKSLCSKILFATVLSAGYGRVFAQTLDAQVIAETSLLKTTSSSPKSTCANDLVDATIVCVYINWSGSATRVDLYEIDSKDGGLSWSSPVQVTSNRGDEYDPFIHYDSKRRRLWLAYGKWHNDRGGSGNDIVISHKDCIACAWSSPVSVAADGKNDYWVPSVLVQKNGTILVFYTKNGPESHFGAGSATIELKRSDDGGATWGLPIKPTKTCDAEYPRAIENSFGSLLLVYGRYIDASHLPKGTKCGDGVSNGYAYTDIHQVWSTDSGRTWKGDAVLYHVKDGSALHAFLGAEKPEPQTPCSTCTWDMFFLQSSGSGQYAVFRMQSANQGLNWSKPMRYSTVSWSTPFNVDPGFVVGCAGVVTNYTSGYGADKVYIQREAGGSTCPKR